MATLEALRGEIARRTTTLHFETHPELEARYGPVGRAKCEEDARHHLSYLDEAVKRHSPRLFLDYIAWAKVLLASLRIPGTDLENNLRCLRQAIDEQGKIGAPATALIDETLKALPTLPDEVESFIDPAGPHAALAKRYLDSLLAGKRRDASRMIMEAVDNGLSVSDVYIHVFQVVQYEIGRLWQMNRVTVAQEHVCTAATQLIMSQLYPRIFGGPSVGRTLVTACVADDLHEIGARILTDFFEMEGWDTHYVGASTPSSALATMAADLNADVVALSVTIARHIPRVEEAVAAVRAAAPNAKIIAGGYPFLKDEVLAAAVGADGTAANAADAVRLATDSITSRDS